MKLRNRKTGEITTLQDEGELALLELIENSLPNGLSLWEKVKEPLIKDEKIRKAVRAWAEANDIKYIEPCARLNKDNYRIVGFNALGRSFTMEISDEYECRITFGKALSRKERGAYTIAELCGEEEE